MRFLLPVMLYLTAAAAAATELPQQLPEYVTVATPVYPALSRRLGEQGTVIIRVLINARGEADAVGLHKSSGFPRLDESALAAVAKTSYRPYRESGAGRSAYSFVPIRFELDPPSPPQSGSSSQ